MKNLILYIGLVAAFLTTSSFLFQAVKTIKTRQTRDISLVMYIVFAIGVFLWFLYGILRNDWPVIIANMITLSFVLIILVLKIIHK